MWQGSVERERKRIDLRSCEEPARGGSKALDGATVASVGLNAEERPTSLERASVQGSGVGIQVGTEGMFNDATGGEGEGELRSSGRVSGELVQFGMEAVESHLAK